MLKTFFVFAIAVAIATCAFANDSISGTMTWVSGIATATITPEAAAQTIVLKVGTTDVTYKDVIIIGNPAEDTIPSGNSVELLLAGSQPFAANMSTDTLVAFTSYYQDAGPQRRAIPMSATGVISDSIGFIDDGSDSALELFYPTCNVANTYAFYGGIDMVIGAPLTKYSVTLPKPGSPSGISSVVFPAGLPENTFDFTASGVSSMEVSGSSTSANVSVSGPFIGSVADFTATEFEIGNATE